jgi:acetyl esterase/lipase
MKGTLETARKKGVMTHSPTAPAVVCIVAVLLICLYSAFAIHRIVASNAPPPPPAFTLGTAYRDVTYCNSQTLDVYVPSSPATRPLPLAIFVHGGGLTAGDKAYLNPAFLKALATAGFAVASLNYRLAPHYKFPAQIQDVKCGIRYLRTHAQGYGVDAGQMFAFGTSYGGTLVALAALTGGHSNFDVGPYIDTSSAIVAAVDMFAAGGGAPGGGWPRTCLRSGSWT